MKKTIKSSRAPKDHLLNKIMQEIEKENRGTQDEKFQRDNTKPPKNRWKKWFVHFILLLISLVFISVLILTYQATKEVSDKEPVAVKNVHTAPGLEKKKKRKEPHSTVNTVPEKTEENLLIFNMSAKVADDTMEKKEKSPDEREKAKRALREQMNR